MNCLVNVSLAPISKVQANYVYGKKNAYPFRGEAPFSSSIAVSEANVSAVGLGARPTRMGERAILFAIAQRRSPFGLAWCSKSIFSQAEAK